MRTENESLNRRELFRRLGKASVAVTAAAPLVAEASSGGLNDAVVVLVRDPAALDADSRIDRKVIGRMLDEGITALTGVRSPQDAWKTLLHPSDIVGVKSNTWSPLPTPLEVEKELVSRILRVGVDSSRISVDDRGVSGNPVFHEATALINVRPMRTHHWSGVGGCVKNYIMFSESPPQFHADACAGVGSIWQRSELKERTCLNVLVMLTPLFHGSGPHHFDKRYTWPYSGILMSTDPVAVDSVGLRILEEQRRAYFGDPRPLQTLAKHVELAETRYGIGIAEFSRIKVVKRGWLRGEAGS